MDGRNYLRALLVALAVLGLVALMAKLASDLMPGGGR
jgi:hypothetical protein